MCPKIKTSRSQELLFQKLGSVPTYFKQIRNKQLVERWDKKGNNRIQIERPKIITSYDKFIS